MSSLLTIPAEIRELIYKYTFPINEAFHAYGHLPPPGQTEVYFSSKKTFEMFNEKYQTSQAKKFPWNLTIEDIYDDTFSNEDSEMMTKEGETIPGDGRLGLKDIMFYSGKHVFFLYRKTPSSSEWASEWEFRPRFFYWKPGMWMDGACQAAGHFHDRYWRLLNHKWISSQYEKQRERFDYAQMIRRNSLLYTCRLIRAEAMPIWYGENTFSTGTSGTRSDIVKGLNDLETFNEYLSTRSDLAVDCIRKVCVHLTPQQLLIPKLQALVTQANTTLLSFRLTGLIRLHEVRALHLTTDPVKVDNCKYSRYVTIYLDRELFDHLPNCTICIIQTQSCSHCEYWRKHFGEHIYAERQSWDWIRVNGRWTIVRRIGSGSETVNSLNDNILTASRQISAFTEDAETIIANALLDLDKSCLIPNFNEDEGGHELDIAEILQMKLRERICGKCGKGIAGRKLMDAQCPSCELIFFCESCRGKKPRDHMFNCIQIVRTDQENAILGRVRKCLAEEV